MPRRTQFTLARLFVVVSVVCVLLGVFVARVHRQRNAVIRIMELGGTVRYRDRNGRGARGPQDWLSRTLGRDYVEDVIEVEFLPSRERISESADMSSGMGMRYTDGRTIDDTALGILEGLPQLEHLELLECSVTDAGICHVAHCVHLRQLYLQGTDVSERGIRSLSRLLNLDTLYLDSTQLTDAGAMELRALTALEVLSLSRASVGDEALAGICSLPRLSWLNVSSTNITDAGLKDLAKCSTLQHLIAFDTRISRDGARAFRAALPSCEIVYSKRLPDSMRRPR